MIATARAVGVHMVVPGLPELYAALGQGVSGFDAIEGTPESEWLDFKRSHYRLADKGQKIELAKDVSGFANSTGGVIVIGVETERRASDSLDIASKLTPVRTSMLNCPQIRDTVRQYVYPPLVGLVCRVWEMEQGKAVMTIEVPKQDSEDRPFVVTEGISQEGDHFGNMFGCFIREGDTTQPLLPSMIHDLMRDGYRLRRMLAGTNLLPVPPAMDDPAYVLSEDEREARATDDAIAASLADGPHLVVQAWKPDRFRIPDIQGQFREHFLRPPQLRPHGGFNIGFDYGDEVLRGGGLRKTRPGRVSLSVLHSGLSTLVVGSPVLGWGMKEGSPQRRELINTIALVEFILEFCRFVCEHVNDGSQPSGARFQAILRCLNVSGPRLLAPGIPGPFFGAGDSRAPAGNAEEIASDIVEGVDPQAAAFELLADIYRGYGLPESDIPFADVKNRAISEHQIVQLSKL